MAQQPDQTLQPLFGTAIESVLLIGLLALCVFLVVLLIVVHRRYAAEQRRLTALSRERTAHLTQTLATFAQIKERYDLVLDHARTGIIELNQQGQIVSCNRVGGELLGTTAAATLGENFHALAHHSFPDGRPYPHSECPMYRAVVEGRSVSVHREVMWRIDGAAFDSTYEAVPLFDNNQPSGAMVIFRDVSEQVNHERELLQSKERLTQAINAKSDFMAKVTHEIRTPLQALRSLLYMARRAKRKAHADRHIQSAEHSIDYVSHIIDDILDYSKIEAGKMELAVAVFSLQETLSRTRDLLLTRARERDVKLLFSIERDVPDALAGDAHRLAQIVINLVSNAIKFSDAGMTVELNVSQLVNHGDTTELVFTVIDTGIGMTSEEQARLFTSYTQANPAVASTHGGTGLGLVISQQLVGLMQGDVHVHSAPGMGSTFTFTAVFGLPETSGAGVFHPAKHEAPPMDDGLAGLYVLLVEDNLDNQRAVKELLEAEGAVVFTADNGREALKKLEDYAVDGVLMDCQMPIMDGFEAAAHIRRERRLADLPIIAMTGAGQSFDRDMAQKSGMDAILYKPVDPAQLIMTLGELLRNR